MTRESCKFCCGKTTGTDQTAQGAFGYLLMIWDRERRHVAVFDKDHVAAALPHHLPAIFGKSLNDFPPAECG